MGWWSGFPYLQTVLVIPLGGILGVTYSIPLRRTLVTNSDLPYPEGAIFPTPTMQQAQNIPY